MLAAPKLLNHTEEATLTKGVANAKMIQDASHLYHVENEDWPRFSDEHYTADQVESFAENIYNTKGEKITLDSNGKYYNVDYDSLSKNIKGISDKKNYILQNPVGKVFYLENISEEGESRIDYESGEETSFDDSLYEFTSATFTNAGATGSTGPTQSQVEYAYRGTEFEGHVTSQDGIQLWTVPKDGIYKIEARGARGGSSNNGSIKGGNGAIISGDFNLKKGEKINILVGQFGGDTSNGQTGGGGGTFVYKDPHSVNPLIAAGGGGGSLSPNTGYSRNTGVGINASASASVFSNIGGSNSGRVNVAGEGAGWGGAGWRTNSSAGTVPAGQAPYAYAPRNGGKGYYVGGFGGGHSTGWSSNAGAGGGYTGGIGAYNVNGARGSGGGSYNSGANQSNLVGNYGHGKVTVIYLGE